MASGRSRYWRSCWCRWWPSATSGGCGSRVKPAKPGLSRSLTVGLLTVLIAAVLTAGGVLGLAYGAGEAALARNRAEVAEIVRAQQCAENPKVKHSAQEIQQQEQNVANLTAEGLAGGTFVRVLLFGLVLALPGGNIFSGIIRFTFRFNSILQTPWKQMLLSVTPTSVGMRYGLLTGLVNIIFSFALFRDADRPIAGALAGAGDSDWGHGAGPQCV